MSNRAVHVYSQAELAREVGQAAVIFPRIDVLEEKLRAAIDGHPRLLQIAAIPSLSPKDEVAIDTTPGPETTYSRIECIGDTQEICEVTDVCYRATKRLLHDRLGSFSSCDTVKLTVEWATEELLENARKHRAASCRDFPVHAMWDLHGDLPYLIVANRGSPLFDPTHYLDRPIEDINWDVFDDNAGSINAHLGTQALCPMVEQISYLWRADDGREIAAMLKSVSEGEGKHRFFMSSVFRFANGIEDPDFNLARYAGEHCGKAAEPWAHLAIGVLFKRSGQGSARSADVGTTGVSANDGLANVSG